MQPGTGTGSAQDPTEFLVVATVRRPHGVRGELYVALDTDRPKSVFRAGRVLWIGDSEGRPVGGKLTVERARPMKDGMLLKLGELASLTPEVEQLRGRSLMIPAADAAPDQPDEVHYRDLRGMEVHHDGARIGPELLVIRRTTGAELLLPFVKEWVAVDRSAKRIDIDPPEGLLEL
jgi:16S rRNA processing protein RimM